MRSQRASQRKVTDSPPEEEEEVDELASSSSSEEEQEWEARAILDERTIPEPDYKKPKQSSHSSRSRRAVPRTITQYLIDWEGFNPETGERWEPSWENGDGATQGLIDEWTKRKETDPEIVGRYTRNAEEKKRRAAAKEKFQRKGLTGQLFTPKKSGAGRVTSGSAVKGGAANAVAKEPVTAEEERDSDSPSTSRSFTSERRKRRNIVPSPIASDEDAEMADLQRSRHKASASRRQAEGSTEKTDTTSLSKRERRVIEEIKRIEEAAAISPKEKRRQIPDASPASISTAGGKRKRSSPLSKRRPVTVDDEEDIGSTTITAKTISSNNGETVRDGGRRKAKKRKLIDGSDDTRIEKDDSAVRTDLPRQDKTSRRTENRGDASSSKSIDGSKISRRASAVATTIGTETPLNEKRAKPVSDHSLRPQFPKEPKASSETNRSQVTESPSVVGDSQPALTSSGESRESQKTPSQRTPSVLGRSDDMRRLVISEAMNQTSLGSPKLAKQQSPGANAEAGPSRIAAVPIPATAEETMDVDREFVPNSLFAMDGHEDDNDSSDMPQSQAIALQRAIDLLMSEENFLEQEQASRSPLSIVEPVAEAKPVEPQSEPPQQTAVEINVDEAAAAKESAGKGKEPSKRGTRKPFSAVDDFVAPVQSAAPALNIPAQTAATSKPLHPLPQIAPSIFRDAGISGTPKAQNTQPDSIHDFDSPHRNTGGEEPLTATMVQAGEQAVAADAANETEVIIEQIISQMPAAAAESGNRPEEEQESRMPELGEDVWSRILDNATIDPSMLGKAPGAVEDEDMSSSEDNSHRSDENAPPAASLTEPLPATGVVQNGTSSGADLLAANTKLRVLESDLARSRLESKQLEEQVEALKADLQASNASHADTHSQSDLVQELEDQVETLRTDLREITDKYTEARSQSDFYKDLYDRAGGTTMRLKRENEELAEDNDKLKAQVATGLKQKQLFLDSFLEAKSREIEQLKAQNELLLQQAQKTDKLRESAGRLPQVEAQLRRMEADRAACGECMRRLDSQISDDSDTEYQPHKKIVFNADTETRNVRSRARAEQEAAVPKPVERYIPVLHAPEQALQSAEARSKLPLTDLRRWAHDRDIIGPAETPLQAQPGLDVAEVDMVYICRWRPEHGNACCALFASTEDLANHALTHHLPVNQETGK